MAATSRTQTGAKYNSGQWAVWTIETNTPSARDQFAAVVDATYGHYVVWGGNSGASYLNDGGQYNVNNGGWLEVSSTDAPSARFGHTGVQSGGVCTSFEDVLFWGGFAPGDSSSFSNTGGVYSSVGTGGWMGATPTGAGVPAGRMAHTAVMDRTNDRMIVWGGSTSTGDTDSGGMLNLCGNTWTSTNASDPDTPSARDSHTAVWTGKTMLVWGGKAGASEYADGGVFTYCWGDPTTAMTPSVVDEDSCTAGLRVGWGVELTWNDYDVHRSVEILRDGTTIASGLDFSDYSYLDTTATAGQSYDYSVRFVNSCGAGC